MRISMPLRSAALLLGCWATLAGAQQPAPDSAADYSHALPLAISGKNAVVQLTVPQEVYLHARSADLRDLRIFNGSGKALPFAMLQPSSMAQASRRELPVSMFPVMQAGERTGTRSDFKVKTSADGSVISVTTALGGQPQTAASGSALDTLVLDLGKADSSNPPAIDALVFTLPEAMSNYHAQLDVETSGDLRQWEALGSASLSWMANSAQQTLVSNRMEFAPRAFRYARLVWREGKPLQFARIVAESPSLSDVPPAMMSVLLQASPGKFEGDLLYQAALAIPVRRLNLQFDSQNVVLPAQLGAYVELPALKGSASTRWEFRPRLQATFFQITQDGKERKSGDVIVGEAHEANWVLRASSPVALRPALKLSWVPDTLVFMASGPGPYTLGVGRERAVSVQQDIAQVAPGFTAAELRGVERAVAGAMAATSAAQDQDSAAKLAAKAARQRMLMLWGVLLLGVLVLGVMAWKLVGQMKAEGK